jgi:hypothetical protein
MSVPLSAAPRPNLASRLQAAFSAFAAPERLQPPSNDNFGNDNGFVLDGATSLADPLALPPDWHAAGDLLSLSFLPFDR